ncbi:(2,3-dihydroxybenzoyl)adenylate synthase [Stackebrandtia nassauensis]|uniref:AMP-dependent synthetase and ligase n=1 Tax=Stackebrandtia nassauensis (strain DSM 44728 / CIP 108903 / NRRL B-16338 / NBRC 102104 / LLR-40K-21) TaxID=446470 RepID=D3Q5B2_STANL|nr:AMP-binding protein [Stackebrandtia nassauensis]ADD44161.1 AMP-dependent synthetase and ligase [Stackebrandtia nassauensis DSM 44728]
MNAPFTPWPEDIAADYRDQGLWTGEPFSLLLERLAAKHGDRVAVTDGDCWLSYESLLERSRRVAAGLHQRGLRPGDIVVMQAANTSEYLVVLFALFRLGVAPVCALPAHREAEIGYFAEHTKAAAYLHPGGAEYDRIAASLDVTHVWTVEQAAKTYADPAGLPPAPRGGDLALLQLSGGSTGVPKLIPRTHDDYLYSVRVAAEVCELTPATVYLCALPVAHNFPLSSPGVLGVLYAGGTVVMAPDPSPDTVFPLIVSEGVTMTAVVPALALTWLRAAEARGAELPSLEVLQVGGARLGDADAERVTPVLGAKLQQVFGMAEGLVCYTRLDDPFATVCATQGRPASEADEVRIVDDADEPVPEGHSGHLLTRGPYTIRGYYRADAHNATAFTSDGFYRTGDLVRRTETGHLIVTGRAKEQINRGGEKIATAEIEEHLRTHPGIHDAALVAVPDDALGERACAFCVTDGELTAKQVRAHLRGRGLAAYKIPDLVRFVASLPRTPVGKIDKNRLKESVNL